MVDAGVYKVKATVTADGYNTKVLEAIMTIIKIFHGITFNSQEFIYDGKAHSIYCDNVPSFASVSYKNNNQTNKGTYTVTATITAQDYETLTLSATLTIKNNKFTGITFKNQTFTYDGYSHSIYVEGAPEFASVSYEGNNKSAIGTYKVTATISATGYDTLTLTATMTISKALPNVDMPNRTLIYDGNNQVITFKYPDNLPSKTNATFKINGTTVTEENFKVKQVGTYTAQVILTNTELGYTSSTTTATIKVISNTIGGTDSTKTAYTITNNYQGLRNKLLEGNFTIIDKSYNYYDRDKDGVYEEQILSTTKTIYVSNGEMFSLSYYADENDQFNDGQTVVHAKVHNSEVLKAQFVAGVLDEINTEKMPESAYVENIIGQNGLNAMALVQEDPDNGGFKNAQQGGYTTTIGAFSIDTINNKFTQITDNYYTHDEFNYSEHSEYTIYNIGNTKINIVNDLAATNVSYDKFYDADYYQDGIKYQMNGQKVSAYLDFDRTTLTYLGGSKEITILPTLRGYPVTKFNQSYYYQYYYSDNELSGLTFKTYFDSSGYYQGEYTDLGYVSNLSYLRNLSYDGATILYYEDWH